MAVVLLLVCAIACKVSWRSFILQVNAFVVWRFLCVHTFLAVCVLVCFAPFPVDLQDGPDLRICESFSRSMIRIWCKFKRSFWWGATTGNLYMQVQFLSLCPLQERAGVFGSHLGKQSQPERKEGNDGRVNTRGNWLDLCEAVRYWTGSWLTCAPESILMLSLHCDIGTDGWSFNYNASAVGIIQLFSPVDLWSEIQELFPHASLSPLTQFSTRKTRFPSDTPTVSPVQSFHTFLRCSVCFVARQIS